MDERKQKVADLLGRVKLMTLASVDSFGKPGAAVIGFAHNEKLQIFFGTSNKSRKAVNFDKNKSVAATFCDIEWKEVQYEGEVRKAEGEELDEFKKIYFEKLPFSEQFENLPDQTYYVIEPRWARYVDVGIDEEFELDLSS